MGNGIIHVRIDDRMIHGIVATQWIPGMKPTRAMAVNDAASTNEIIRQALRISTPNNVALSVLATAKAAENLNAGKYADQRVFVVGKFIADIYALFKAGVEIPGLCLGNVTQNATTRDDLTVLAKTVRVNPDELAMLKEMQAGGVEVYTQFRLDDPKNVCQL